jgi:hypothetical protein
MTVPAPGSAPNHTDYTIRVGDLVEIGLAYKMADHPPFTDRHTLEPDEVTGRRGIVVQVCSDGDLEIECSNGRDVFVHRDRVRLILGGVAQSSTDETRWPEAIERGLHRQR